jgi:hypothetical protein
MVEKYQFKRRINQCKLTITLLTTLEITGKVSIFKFSNLKNYPQNKRIVQADQTVIVPMCLNLKTTHKIKFSYFLLKIKIALWNINK